MFEKISNLAELLANPPPPPLWIVEDMLVEGATLLAGPPKIGKSYFVYQIAKSVIDGTLLFGKLPTKQGRVLYLALEDSPSRIYVREQRQGIISVNNSALDIAYRCTPGKEVVNNCREFKEQFPDTLLIIIDTLEKIRGARMPNSQIYSEDYDFMGSFQELGLDYHMSIVLNHHTRKEASEFVQDSISGSRGLTGGTETNMVLNRFPGPEHYAKLFMQGKEVPEKTLLFDTDPTTFVYTLANVTRGGGLPDKRAEIVKLLADCESLSPKQIADLTKPPNVDAEKHHQNVRKMLSDMVRVGQLIKVGTGAYAVPSDGTP